MQIWELNLVYLTGLGLYLTVCSGEYLEYLVRPKNNC